MRESKTPNSQLLIIALILGIILGFIGGYGYATRPMSVEPDGGIGIQEPAYPIDGGGGAVACTMEAKICPDGTAVGRSGPNCEFTPCP